MEANTMREVMLVLSMAAAACGTVQAPGRDDSVDPAEPDADGAPVITVERSTVHDERGDMIDFSDGEPLHIHAGPTIDLAVAGCPAVYKYAYLMDDTIPFGVNVTPNPLAWRVKISDMTLETGSASFRVRTDDGTVLGDWLAVPPPDADGISTIELTRSGRAVPVQELGSRTGTFLIEIKARDSIGNETEKIICFDHHPLQAPVSIGAFRPGKLFSVDLVADTPAAFMLNEGGEVEVVWQAITQQTAEATTLTWSATSSNVTFSKSTFDGYVSWEKSEQINCLIGRTDPRCATTWAPPAAAGAQSASGSFTPAISVGVVDAVDGQTIATSPNASITVTLPGRAAGEPPHDYRFVVKSSALTALQPVSLGGAFGEYSLLQSTYTGSAPQDAGVHCVSMVQTGSGPVCQRTSQHYRFSALDQATLNLNVSSQTQQDGSDVAYVPAKELATNFMWSSGNDSLPGGY